MTWRESRFESARTHMKMKVKRIKKEIRQFHREFKRQLTTLIVGSFSFVTALLWRDAINAIIEKYISGIKPLVPLPNVYLLKIYVALAVTVLSVFIVVLLSRISASRSS